MFSSNEKLINTNNYFSVLFALLPVSFIAGNLIINFHVLIIILSTLFFYWKDLFKIKFLLLDKFFLLFFIIVIFSGLYNDIYFLKNNLRDENYNTTIKSFLFLRYLLLYFSLRFLVSNQIINLKYFFISCLFSTLFVSYDIFHQLIFGKDIFGFALPDHRKISGPFGEELIAGGYLLRYSIFSLFFVIIFNSQISNKMNSLILIILLVIFFTAIILSGNRMPLLMYIFTLFLIMTFQKQFKKFIIVFFSTFIIIFSLLFNFNSKVQSNFINFYGQISKMITIISKKDFENAPTYLKEFYSFYDVWLINKYTGGGIKNFWYYCQIESYDATEKIKVCNTHPHNYYLEILTELGLVGFLIIIVIFYQILYLTFYRKYFTHLSLKCGAIITPFIFLFISEIFPFKGTGSFFTTNNATYLFIIIGTLIGLINRNNSIENRK